MIAVVLAFGCGPTHDFAYRGTWIGHRKLHPSPGTDPHVADEVSRLSLTLKNGGNFTMFDAGIKKDGEYTVEGDHAVLSVERILDQPISRQTEDVQKLNVPISLTPTGKNLKFVDPTGFDKGGLILERSEAPATNP